jgi:NAD(P)H-dependent flavin oxidoreductase YrpB (nitropropane dioxygenase family)
MVYNPAGVFDAGYFSQVSQAGALPVFDTELMADDKVISHIDELAKSGFLFGIRISAARENIFNYLNEQVIRNCDAVIVSYDNIDELKKFRPGTSPYTIITEVTDIGINDILEAIDPHALILRGFEAPGRCSRYTSFILLQWYAEKSRFPFFVHGGVGYFTAAGMFAAGASGLVLDNQLFLAEEAPVCDEVRTLIMKLEESDSLSVADGSGVRRRFFSKLGTKIVKEMKKKADSGTYSEKLSSLYDEVRKYYLPVDKGNGDPMQRLFYLGQDAIFARYFAKDTRKTGEIIQNFFKRINEELSLIDSHDPMVEGSILAREHGTRFPIVQGPMANISDSVEFAKKVYEAGALPFFAMGSLPPDLAEGLITGGNEHVKSYGAGMIGVLAFNKNLPEHMEIVKKHRAPFALFAAGTPSVVKELEASGTKAYLHTPSMSMLENAISTGCRRFIFEGTEAGGHVGNLSSMVLWELALEMVHSLPESQAREIRLLFAGGVGTVHGSHFISGMTSSTAMRGCGIGVQVATPYLFTKEILETGALTKVYQDVMCRENGTIIIGDTVGLHARTVASPFSKRIHENEVHRVTENIPLTERKELFEHDNTGSLLIGAKAFHLDFSEPGKVNKIPADEKEQYEKGNFMAGDILAVDDKQITITEIHERIISRKELMNRTLGEIEIIFGDTGTIRDEIAIIGMGCVYPDAKNPDEYWQNIISKRYSIKDMPDERLKPVYYDKDKKAEDKTYTKIAAHVHDYVFDNKKYGYSDVEADGLSRSQKMILDAAMNAVRDAGYMNEWKKLPSKRTAVIIASCLTNEMNSDLQLKYYYPELLYYLEQIDEFRSLGEDQKQKIRDKLKMAVPGHLMIFLKAHQYMRKRQE